MIEPFFSGLYQTFTCTTAGWKIVSGNLTNWDHGQQFQISGKYFWKHPTLKGLKSISAIP
jgi:hypothetical protein